MRCLVTCGPTYEPLDQVRRLTNFSTGTLGIKLANALNAHGHEVHLLKGYYSTSTEFPGAVKVEIFTTTDDLARKMKGCSANGFDAVFHAAAVSDFGFGQVYTRETNGDLTPVQAGKFGTQGKPLLAHLEPTVKILPQLRGWFGDAFIAGWKYEVDGDRTSAVAKGVAQISHCQSDVAVVNGPAYGNGFEVIQKVGTKTHCADHKALYEKLINLLEKQFSI
ncbi:MAG: phosphopantothenoylcysteine decarboxylase [Verrucomicrobiales bacterium]